MKVLLSWLREFAPLVGTAEEIADQLTALGMELESVTTIGIALDGVVVAEVLDVRAHPDADRIRLVDVDAGDGQPLQICCGASNMVAGDLVALATIGTVMANGMEIAKRKMRGQESNGMLCSASELELGDDHNGILILPPDLAAGTPLIDALGLSVDVAYEFDALPNRPDTLSVLGVARDLAAHQGVPLSIPRRVVPSAGPDAGDMVSVDIADPVLCGRFELRTLSGVEVGPSPRWLAQRLIASGMRPINNIVDVSNYVMLELGQPNHTYDLDKLPGGALGVRRAKDGETIVTLDAEERTLDAADGVIVDAEDRPVGIAGVMGGASTEISASTTAVAVELAWWNPDDIAESSTRLNLHSEASLRFKRGVDWRIAPVAADRICQLLTEVAGATAHPGAVVAEGQLPTVVTVDVRPEKVNALLGTTLSTDDIVGLLDPIGYTSVVVGGGALAVEVPSWRRDSTIEVDVIEEVARHFGYANLTRTVPVSPHTGELSARQQERRALRRALVGAGLSEAMPMPFLAPGDLERCGLPADGLVLANPLAAEESVLRTSLMPGLLAAVARNGRHRNPGARLFEVGRVFGPGAGDRTVITDVAESQAAGRVLAGESEHAAAALAGVEAPDAVRLLELLLRTLHRWPDDDSTVLVATEVPGLHPGRSAVVQLAAGQVVGSVGEVDPDVLAALGIDERVAWLDLDLTVLLAEPAEVPLARAVSLFPSSDIDLAFVVQEDVAAAAVRNTIAAAVDSAADPGTQPVGVELFDVFRSDQLGSGAKSLAFRLRFQAADRTLTDDEVARMRSVAIDAVAAAHAGAIRG